MRYQRNQHKSDDNGETNGLAGDKIERDGLGCAWRRGLDFDLIGQQSTNQNVVLCGKQHVEQQQSCARELPEEESRRACDMTMILI